MSNNLVSGSKSWGLSWEKYFYYFMGLRKGELKKDMAIMKEQYPDDDADQLARRVVNAQVPLSVLGGAVLHVPFLVPGISPVLKFLGIATGTSVMVILNMTMLLQIALVYGYNIDDRARLKEMGAIIAASGLAGGSTLLPIFNTLSPNYRALAGATTVTTVSQLIGEAAIRYYRSAAVEDTHAAPVQAGKVSV
jgi:hypothetical protein